MSWFGKHAGEGWASAPITQNGCIRVMSSPGYPKPIPTQAVIRRLADACRDSVHEFWADDVSLLNPQLIDATRIHGPRQLTDVYLLALAVRCQGRFITFDSSVSLDAVRGATTQHRLVL